MRLIICIFSYVLILTLRRKLEEAVEILYNEVNYLYIFLRSYSDLFYLFIVGVTVLHFNLLKPARYFNYRQV